MKLSGWARFWRTDPDISEETYTTGLVWFGQIRQASRADALAYVSAWVEKYIETPATVGAYLHKYRDGYLFELQERGIGKKAWLPSLLQTWDRQREAGLEEKIFLALDRIIEGARHEDRITFIVLPENQTGIATSPGLAADGPALRSLRPDMEPLEKSSKIFLTASLLILLASLGIRTLLPEHTDARLRVSAPPLSIIRMPIGQWPALLTILREGDYVSRMQYRNFTWQLVPNPREQPTSGGPPGSAKPGETPKPIAKAPLQVRRPS